MMCDWCDESVYDEVVTVLSEDGMIEYWLHDGCLKDFEESMGGEVVITDRANVLVLKEHRGDD